LCEYAKMTYEEFGACTIGTLDPIEHGHSIASSILPVETCASALYTPPHTELCEALHAEVNHVFTPHI